MNDIYSLLNINRDVLRDFHLLANRVADHQTERVINQSIRKLKSIEERMAGGETMHVSQQSIDEVLYKVVQASQAKSFNMENWSMHELRIVSYYLMLLQDEEEAFDYALRLLNRGWRNMYINGLVFFLMNSWCLIKPELRIKTSMFVVSKLREYQDQNRRYLLLKNHVNLLEEAGPHRLAQLLISRNKDIKEAPLVLGCKASALSQSYFSDVIVKYCAKLPFDEDKLEEIFEVHGERRTKQLVFADLVQKAEESGDTWEQTKLSRFINRTLGDVTLTSTWAPFSGATLEEAQRLRKAMEQVSLWFTRRIIETFFEVCVQDKDRKTFWLNYVQFVSGFKIVGSTSTKRSLQNDPRVNTMFHPHFIETNSRYSQTAALVLSINDYILVEFSDTGALYAYKQDNEKVQFLRRGIRYMSSTNDLKDTSLDTLVEISEWGSYYNRYNDEGRLRHIGYWQDRLNKWIMRKALLSGNSGKSFFDTRNDSIFTETPLPKQEKIKKPAVTSEKIKVEEPQKQSNPQKTVSSGNVFKTQTKSFTPEVPSRKSEPVSFLSTKILTVAVYEKNVKYQLTSKWFFFDNCRVVGNSQGFYVNIFSTKRFIKIREGNGIVPSGNIWIKRPNTQGWSTIVYAPLDEQSLVVGYIKQAGGGLIFKHDMKASVYMTIKTK